ncbi:MAG: NAD(+) diphosphatase [Pseudomonadota bacterium]
MDSARRSPLWSLNGFTGGRLARAPHRRKDAGLLARALARPESRIVPVWQGKLLVRTRGGMEAVLLAPAQAEPLTGDAHSLTFLGERDGHAVFALGTEAPAAGDAMRRHGTWGELRQIASAMDRDDASVLAYARAMAIWHGTHRYCGRCGQPTESEEAGHLRRCVAETCRQPVFPRTDPAIITLVASGERCVLGRQPIWPEGFYSTLAGFVEPGESLEQALIREVMEEAGIVVRDARYHSSQPWPFPGSLMVGFTAFADDAPLTVDRDELEDARWFSRADIAGGLKDGVLKLPPRVSIAWRLIEDWFDAGGGAPLASLVAGT